MTKTENDKQYAFVWSFEHLYFNSDFDIRIFTMINARTSC